MSDFFLRRELVLQKPSDEFKPHSGEACEWLFLRRELVLL